MDSCCKCCSANRPRPDPKDYKVLEELVPNKLQARNYVEWRKQMENFIKLEGLLGFTDGTVNCPPETPRAGNGPNGGSKNSEEKQREKYEAWKESDGWARKCIESRVTYSIKKQAAWFRGLNTAKEVWDALSRLDEDTRKKLNHYLPLYKATIEGNWEIANEFIQKEPGAVGAPITFDSETALIVAVRAVKRNNFVNKLVQKMSQEQLAIGDFRGLTALHRAAGSGNINAAKLLVEQNQDLPNQITSTKDKKTPLFYAAARGERKMILWLMERTKTEWLEGESGFHILYQLTISKHYDIALTLLRDHRNLASIIPPKEEDLKCHALTALARNPCSFPSGNDFNFLERLIDFGMMLENIADRSERDEEAPPANAAVVEKRLKYEKLWKVAEKFGRDSTEAFPNLGGLNLASPKIKAIRENKMLHDPALALLQLLCDEVTKSGVSNADRIFQLALERATSVGIPEIVEKILESYPNAVYLENNKKQSIFQQAIVFRKEKVFNLIHQLEESKEILLSKWDALGDHALHSAAKVVDPQLVYLRASAAFQMQREIQWFKEVDRLALSKNKDDRNTDGKTPAQVFNEEHKELVKAGKRWMKDTAGSCIIIASLIVTMMFAAAITVPGARDDNGHPNFYQRRALIIFGIANGLALFSSIASVVMFLSVLTSSFAEEDFLFTLPNRLIISLISLFASILFAMGAFGATIYLVFGESNGWILIMVVVMGCIPVLLFGFVQFPLLKRMVKSTYGSSIFVKRSDRMLL